MSEELRKYTVAAYYFPNWHRKPGERGAAFGEWPVLKRARPRFPGHRHPIKPLWGYDDESDPRAMAKKIDAAADHGVNVFLFDWYFNRNGTFLERALNDGYLKAKNNDRVQFALMWANHNLGKGNARGAIPRRVFDKLVAHVVKNFLTHPSYWKIDGRAYFSIYEIGTFIEGFGTLAKAREAIEHFDRSARDGGLNGVHLNVVDWQLAYRKDAAKIIKSLRVDSVTPYVWPHLYKLDFPTTDYCDATRMSFDHAERASKRYRIPYFPNVTVGWDPTPRIAPGKPHANAGYPDTGVFVNNTPANFKAALRRAKAFVDCKPQSQRIVSLYAWNEWTEGGFLEPDTVNRYAYLRAIRDVFTD